MKRLTGAFLIAVLLFYLTVSAEIKMEKNCGELSAALDICAESIKTEEFSAALEVLDGIRDKWYKNEALTGIVVGNGGLIVDGMDIDTVYNCISDRNYSQALLLIRKIQSCFKQAVEDRQLSPDNIL